MAMATIATLPVRTPVVRCAAAPAEDPDPCVGSHAVVRIVDRHGSETTGCVHHAAVLYASLVNARVYASPGHNDAATEVYARAQSATSFAWRAAA